jgi:phosphonate transport system permease protein
MDAAPALPFDPVLVERRRRLLARAFWTAAALFFVGGCLAYSGFFEVSRYVTGVPAVLRIVFTEGFPPDFRVTGDALANWWAGTGSFKAAVPWAIPLWDTLIMSIAGTALAIAMSFVLGFLAARPTSPNPAVYVAARGLLNFLRAVPELIMGIVFLVAVGVALPPILPGVLALAFHSVGMVGKFFAEAIEHSDPAPVEAVRACGGRGLQVLWHGVLPQVLPRMADVAFYRWEYNFRASLVMGMVGCGGIGLEIQSALALMEYRQLTALLILVLACGTWLRRRLA